MNLIQRVYHSLRWKKNDQWCADKLGMSLSQYQSIKGQITKVQDVIQEDLDTHVADLVARHLTQLEEMQGKDQYISELEETLVRALDQQKQDRVIEYTENLEKGTATIKALTLKEPKTAEEIERILKLDKTRWKLSTYWNKEHKDMWLVSAQVSARNESEMNHEDAEAIIRKVFSEVPGPHPVTYPDIHNDKALFIYTSDKHIAACVDQKRSMFRNEYTGPNYETRMALVLHEIHYLTQVYGTFRDIYVIDLGDKMDGLDGKTTRGGHALPQNMSNREAFETALRVEKKFYDLLFHSGNASNYHVIHNMNSNHGGDFDYMVNRALEEHINARYPEVRTRNLEQFIEHEKYGVHTILLTHGKDDADLKHGLPLHLNDKTENFLNKYLMFHGIDPQREHVSVVKADLHTNNSQDSYGFRYRNVLSLFGGSKWVGNNFGPCKPGCSFDIYERDTERVLEHRIFFAV